MTQAKARILIVDDEPGITLGLADQLEMEGYEVLVRSDGRSGLEAVESAEPDLVLLDVMMPKLDGYEVCRRIRSQNREIPIMMLTAKGEEVDKVLGLEFGADDYVTKPFGLRELVARIKAILRRAEIRQEKDEIEQLNFDDVKIDFLKFEAFKGDQPVEMTPRELRILKLFAERPGEVITRDHFLDEIWGKDVYVTSRSVDTQISSIRKKLGDDGDKPRFFVSVRTVGYKFVPEGESGGSKDN